MPLNSFGNSEWRKDVIEKTIYLLLLIIMAGGFRSDLVLASSNVTTNASVSFYSDKNPTDLFIMIVLPPG